MFRTVLRSLGAIGLFLTATVTLADLASANSAKLRLAHGNDYRPFSDESLPGGGLASEITTAAFRRLGIDVEYVFLDWKDGFDRTAAGEFDGTLPYLHSEKRDNLYAFTDSVYTTVLRWFLKSGKPVPRDVASARGKVVCTPTGYVVPNAVQAEFDAGRMKKEEPTDLSRCMELLALDRVDFVMANELTGWSTIRANPDLKLNRLNVVVVPIALQLGTHSVIIPHVKGPKSCNIAARFNGALALMRYSGEFDKLVARRLGDNVGERADPLEVYRVVLRDGTEFRGRPREYQRGVFLIDAVDSGKSGTQIVPEGDLVLLRRQGTGTTQYGAGDDACQRGIFEPPPPLPEETGDRTLTLAGNPASAAKVVPELIRKFAGTRTLSRRAKDGEVVYEVSNAGQNFPSRIRVLSGSVDENIARLASGEADLLVSDRPVTPQQVQRYVARTGDLTTDQAQKIVGLQAMAFVVHPDNPLISVEAADLLSVLTGRIRRWDRLGLNNGPIQLLGVPSARQLADNVTLPSASAKEVIARVASERGALGVIPMSLVNSERVRAVAVATCGAVHRPVAFTAKTEEYPFLNRLYLYLPANNKKRFVGDFVAFAEGDGQAAVAEAAAINLTIDRQSFQDQYAAIQSAESRGNSAKYPLQNRRAVSAYMSEIRRARRLSVTFRFRSGSSTLDSRAIRDARRLAAFIRKGNVDANAQFLLFGFADSRGPAGTNLSLSQRRAASVADSLVAEGVVRSRVRVESVGEDLPVACNDDAAGQSLNRRVEVWLR